MPKSFGAANSRPVGLTDQPRQKLGGSSFAEQLVGTDRTERGEKPGREERAPSTSREGQRSDESDSGAKRAASSKSDVKSDSRAPERAATAATAKSDRPETARRKVKATSAEAPELRETQLPGEPTAAQVQAQTQAQVSARPMPMRDELEAESDVQAEPIDGASPTTREPNIGKPVNGNEQAVGAMAMAGTSRIIAETPQAAAQAKDPIADILEAVRQDQGQVHKSALQNFMSNMQNEFGISPDKIVEAFSKMDEKTLMAPPEESTKEFLNNLQMPADKAARAGDLYKQMVRSTGDAALNEKLIGIEQQGGVNVDVLSPKDQALKQLNSAIDDLNNSFAMRNQPTTSLAAPLDNPLKAQLAAEQMSAQLRELQRMQGTDQKDPKERGSESGMSESALAGMSAATAAGTMTGAAAGTSTSAADASATAGGIAGATGGGQLAALNAGGFGSALSGDAGAGFGSQAGDSSIAQASATSAKSSVAAKSTFAASMSAAEAKAKTNKGEMKAENVDATAGQALNDPQALAAQTAAPVQTKAGGTGAAGMILERPVATAQDEQENVKELLRQAQVVVKKGGGEIKMDLKPEGIGQVHLKVSVDGGQVSVQMLTQNDEAKRVLEKGLHELKSSLAAHELKVDNLKVDVGTDIQKHMDKGADDQARQQTRQFAQDVMSNMRDERQAMQQGFMENRGWRQYPQNRARDGVQPDASSAMAVAAKRGEAVKRAGTSRLDLVA